jgi:hypothetical protein
VDREPTLKLDPQEIFMKKRVIFVAAVLAAVLTACGGGDEPPVELSIDANPVVAGSSVILSGNSFVPAGSDCPPWTNPFVPVFGTLGPHEIRYLNAATGINGPARAVGWVCNSDDGRTMSWVSNPISLATGDNVITVTMTGGGRTSSASITIRR